MVKQETKQLNLIIPYILLILMIFCIALFFTNQITYLSKIFNLTQLYEFSRVILLILGMFVFGYTLSIVINKIKTFKIKEVKPKR